LKNCLEKRADAIKVDEENFEDTDDRYILPLDEDDDMEPFEEPPSEAYEDDDIRRGRSN